MDFYSRINVGVAYQKHMEFSPKNDRFSFLEPVKPKKNSEPFMPTRWCDIAKVVLNKDKGMLDSVLSEINPEYRSKLLDKPLIPVKPQNKISENKIQPKVRHRHGVKKQKETSNEEKPCQKIQDTTIADVLKTAVAFQIGKKQAEISRKRISLLPGKKNKPYKAMFQMLLDKSYKRISSRRVGQSKGKASQLLRRSKFKLMSLKSNPAFDKKVATMRLTNFNHPEFEFL